MSVTSYPTADFDKSGHEIRFEPPAPGTWMLDTTHHGRRPLTGFMAPVYPNLMTRGMPAMFERYGLPLERVKVALVEGCVYVRLMGVGEPESGGAKQPPGFVFKLLSRLHPEMRRRNRTAEAAWQHRIWREDVDKWFDVDRPVLVTKLVELGRVAVADLEDDALLDHLDEAVELFAGEGVLSFSTHGGDLVPVGDYLAHCQTWGIDLAAASTLLTGSSPASREVADTLAPVWRAVAGCTATPTSLDELRALGAEVSAAIDRWLELHGNRLLFSDDIDSPTLAERVDLQLATLLASPADPTESSDDSTVRSSVPPCDRALFDDLLDEARYGLRLRDDNVGVRWLWCAGLIRRALLEVGRRLVERELALDAAHALELSPDEVRPLVLAGRGPAPRELGRRSNRRLEVERSSPPDRLGPESPPPPIHAMPAPLARAASAVMASVGSMQGEPGEVSAMRGVGVGSSPYRGVARVLSDASEAIASVAPGDIVVTAFTGPAWNSVLPIVGGLVVEEGGPMCHAAIMARELGIPALIGVRGATTKIPDGCSVELDPISGLLTLVE